MATTLANAENALKTYYLDAISSQLNDYVNPFFAAIEKSTNDVWGKEVKKLAISGINGGIGSGSEDGALPQSGTNKYLQLTSTLKNLYGVIEISDKAIRASENNAGAFVSLLNSEMEGLIKASKINFSRMLFGDGTGELARISGASDGYITVTKPNNLIEGMKVSIANDNGEILEEYGIRTILEIDRALSTVKLTGTTEEFENASQDLYLHIQNSCDKELTGLEAIFNLDKPLYGADRAGNAILKPYVNSLMSAVTEDDIQKVLDEIEIKTGSSVNFIICSHQVKRTLQKLFSQNKTNVDNVELAGGYKTMSYNGIPIVADRFCKEGAMYFLNTKDFALHQLCDWEWLAGDDGKILKQVPGKPVYTATLVKYAELMCSCPAGQGVLYNVK
jgi:hypothetical protein